ncbi:MAG: hypothetical protein LBV41_03035 [Cytophagaceae bacterium]|jgi:hypothetical protein|nr:hypothetical protein [Cytophagaceae bacterium]
MGEIVNLIGLGIDMVKDVKARKNAKKADISLRTSQMNAYHTNVHVINHGPAIARNIRIYSPMIDNCQGVFMMEPEKFTHFPELYPGEEDKIILQVTNNDVDMIDITLTWDDDSGKDRSKQQTVRIY